MTEAAKQLQRTRAARARKGSRRRRDIEALRQERAAEAATAASLREAGRELFPEAAEKWWPVVGVAARRFHNGGEAFTPETIARHLEQQGYQGAEAELLSESAT